MSYLTGFLIVLYSFNKIRFLISYEKSIKDLIVLK